MQITQIQRKKESNRITLRFSANCLLQLQIEIVMYSIVKILFVFSKETIIVNFGICSVLGGHYFEFRIPN